MDIGLFQLENLVQNPNMFLMVDLRAEIQPAHPSVDRLLARAEKIPAGQIESHLKEKNYPKERPIVLVCGDGRASLEAARALENAGFDQIYVVAGGVSGLLSEV